VGLARILFEEHEPEAAERQLRAVVAEYPENAEAHYVLMLVFRGEKKIQDAATEMATFNRLQTEKAQTFQSKMNALMNGKLATGEALPK
jgi:hypothetical protein